MKRFAHRFLAVFGPKKRSRFVLFLCLFAAMGVSAILLTKAATSSVHTEAEAGNISYPAKRITDNTASSNSAVNFGGTFKSLWTGDAEEGTLADFSQSDGGGSYPSGNVASSASREQAHSGSWSYKLTINGPASPTSGNRLFRWQEARSNRVAHYSAWYYFPTNYDIPGQFWNIFQFKSRSSDNSLNDPLWALYPEKISGNLYIRAGWGWGATSVPGPFASSNKSGKWYTQRVRPIPIGRWFKIDAYLKQSNAFDGTLTIWQDGEKILNLENIRTSYSNCNYNSWCAANEWSVNNYSDGLSPYPATIYIDDAEITKPIEN